LFTEALTTLGQGFNIDSLRRRWDPKFALKQAIAQKFNAAALRLGKK
jgi:hypothetical protein